MEKLLSVDQVRELIGLKPWAIYRKIERGEIPAIRIGRATEYKRLPAGLGVANRALFGAIRA